MVLLYQSPTYGIYLNAGIQVNPDLEILAIRLYLGERIKRSRPVLYEARKALLEALYIPIGSWDHARFHTALRNPRQAILITRWIIVSGRLPEYGLATEFEARKREDK